MPFGRFPGADTVLGPEMKSTGEVMGVAEDFPAAYAKSQLAIDYSLPTEGRAFVSVCDRDKRAIVSVGETAAHARLRDPVDARYREDAQARRGSRSPRSSRCTRVGPTSSTRSRTTRYSS